jgi:predicted DNA-binding transcriptional regulator AlpA
MKRADVTARLPIVFGLNRIDAAAAIGVSSTTFDRLVAEGKMPKPHMIGSRKVWDVDEVRQAFKSLPKQDDGEEIDTWADVV